MLVRMSIYTLLSSDPWIPYVMISDSDDVNVINHSRQIELWQSMEYISQGWWNIGLSRGESRLWLYSVTNKSIDNPANHPKQVI